MAQQGGTATLESGRFVEVGRIQAVPFTSRVKLMPGGDRVAYFAPGPAPHQWGWADPFTGSWSVAGEAGDGRGQSVYAEMATGTKSRGIDYVLHDGRVSILRDGVYSTGRLLKGRPLAAKARSDGSALILTLDAGDTGAALMHITLITPEGKMDQAQATYPESADWVPWHVTIGTRTIYTADMNHPYRIVAFDFSGRAKAEWGSSSSWTPKSRDRHGRPHSMVLAMHEVEDRLYVVSAVRKANAPDAYGTFWAFEGSNDFVLETRSVLTGEVLSTTHHTRPPFYGSLWEDIVYRIDQPHRDHAPEISFLRIQKVPL